MELTVKERILLYSLVFQIQPKTAFGLMCIENIKNNVRLTSKEIENVENTQTVNIELTKKELDLLKDYLEEQEDITDEVIELAEKLNII